MFYNDNASGNGENQQAPQFFQFYQAATLPHAVASVGRATPLNIRRERSPQYLAASSSSRTAKSGRWSMMPPKRTASGSPSGTPGKTVKTEQKPEDFSNSVKKRLQSSTRTGQACDRCKVYILTSSSRSASINKVYRSVKYGVMVCPEDARRVYRTRQNVARQIGSPVALLPEVMSTTSRIRIAKWLRGFKSLNVS